MNEKVFFAQRVAEALKKIRMFSKHSENKFRIYYLAHFDVAATAAVETREMSCSNCSCINLLQGGTLII